MHTAPVPRYATPDPDYEHWQRQAAGWERCADEMSETMAPVTAWLVDALDPRPGQTLLELAAGPGDAGFAAARRLGDGRLLQTDRSPAMLAAARRRAARLGIENVEWREMDALDLPLGDGSVDGVICRFGYMLTGDPLAALRETRRVLRRGGRLAFAVWDTPRANPWATVAGAVIEKGGYAEPPEPGSPGPFTLGDAALVSSLVQQAGFPPPRIETIDVAYRYRDFDAYWRASVSLSGRMAQIERELEPARLEQLRAEIDAAFAPYRDEHGLLTLPGRVLVAAAA